MVLILATESPARRTSCPAAFRAELIPLPVTPVPPKSVSWLHAVPVKLVSPDFAMTRMAGPPDRMQLEQTYADALAAVTRWSVSSGRLQMSDSNALVLEFVNAE